MQLGNTCGSTNPLCILGFDFQTEMFQNQAQETLKSAQLYVYWKPKLSKKRSSGSFRAKAHDVLKLKNPHLSMVMDTKKIYHRDEEMDAGYLIFLCSTYFTRNGIISLICLIFSYQKI